MKALKGPGSQNLWVTIERLKEEDMLAQLDIRNSMDGNPPRKRVRQVYVDLQRRLKTLCTERVQNVRTMEDMLRGVGRNIRWKAPINQMDN